MRGLVVVGVVGLAWGTAGGTEALAQRGGPLRPPPAIQVSPEQEAMAAYNDGLKQTEKADRLAAEAAAQGDPARCAKLEDKARSQYEKAVKKMEEALRTLPDLPDAHAGLGYARLKLGRHQAALQACDRTLELRPGHAAAIACRGEACLGLDRLDDARNAYVQLVALDRDRARTLLAAMRRWLDERRRDPAGLDEEALRGFEAWLKGREDLAQRADPQPAGPSQPQGAPTGPPS